MLGFEGNQGNCTPKIRGIVVHQHNKELVEEAFVEFQQHVEEQQETDRQRRVLGRWKKLINSLLVKNRLEKEYGPIVDTDHK